MLDLTSISPRGKGMVGKDSNRSELDIKVGKCRLSSSAELYMTE